MREIRIDDIDFKVRGLTRGEIKTLRSEGINLMNLTVDNADAAYERVFEMVLPAETVLMLDNLENKISIAVWQAIIKETFGAWDEEKNLSRSGNGTQTDSE